MRGEPAQPKSEPVKEVTEPAPAASEVTGYHIRERALQVALSIPRDPASAEQLLADAKAIELYLKGAE